MNANQEGTHRGWLCGAGCKTRCVGGPAGSISRHRGWTPEAGPAWDPGNSAPSGCRAPGFNSTAIAISRSSQGRFDSRDHSVDVGSSPRRRQDGVFWQLRRRTTPAPSRSKDHSNMTEASPQRQSIDLPGPFRATTSWLDGNQSHATG